MSSMSAQRPKHAPGFPENGYRWPTVLQCFYTQKTGQVLLSVICMDLLSLEIILFAGVIFFIQTGVVKLSRSIQPENNAIFIAAIFIAYISLYPAWCQAIIWTNTYLVLDEPLGTNYSDIWTKIKRFSCTKMDFLMSPAKCHPFCLGSCVLFTLYGAHSDAYTDVWNDMHRYRYNLSRHAIP